MSCAFKATWVGVPDPRLQYSDLVQSFTEALATNETIWQIGKERFAMSSRSIKPSSAGWVLQYSSHSSQLELFSFLRANFFEGLPSRETAGCTAKVNPAAGQIQATRSKVKGWIGQTEPKKKGSGQPASLRATDVRSVLDTLSGAACWNARMCYMKLKIFNLYRLLLLILLQIHFKKSTSSPLSRLFYIFFNAHRK